MTTSSNVPLAIRVDKALQAILVLIANGTFDEVVIYRKVRLKSVINEAVPVRINFVKIYNIDL